MKLRVCAFVLGIVSGFLFAWARLTDPDTFHRMFGLHSARVYLLMASAVAVAFVGARAVRGRRGFLTGEPIDWTKTRPTRSHVAGSIVFGLGWAISDACPGPAAAQLGEGRILTIAVAAGVVAGVWLQPAIARFIERARRSSEGSVSSVAATDVL